MQGFARGMLKAETGSAGRAVRRSLGLKSEQGLGRIRDEAGETEQCRALRTTKMGRTEVVEDLPFQSFPLMSYKSPTPVPMFSCCPRSNGDMDIANCHSLWHPKSEVVEEGYRMEEGHIFIMRQENVSSHREGDKKEFKMWTSQRQGRCQMVTAANTVPVEALWNGCLQYR